MEAKSLMRYSLILIINFLILGCASVDSLYKKGLRSYKSYDYEKAERFYSKALSKKGNKEKVYEGLFFVNYHQDDIRSANSWISKAYGLNSNHPNHIYNYALTNSLLENYDEAMDLLYKLGDNNNFDYYRRHLIEDDNFTEMRSNSDFNRLLMGYRRIKIRPYEAYCGDSDGLFNSNDLFAMIEYDNKIILVTDVIQERNKAYWNNDYVILDYKFGTPLSIILMEEDIFEHDKYIHARGSILSSSMGEIKLNGYKSYLKVEIEDTEYSTYTTGTYLPEEVSLGELALGIGAVYLMSNSDELDNSFISRLFDCTTKAGISYFVENPVHATIVTEAYDSIRQKEGSRFNRMSSSVAKGLLISELKNQGNDDLANIIEAGDYIYCLFDD